MGLEYGIRLHNAQAERDGRQGQWLLDMMHSQLVFAFGNHKTYRIVYHNQKLTVLQDYEAWPEVMEIWIDLSEAELEGMAIGEPYVHILCHVGGAFVKPLLDVIDGLLEQLMPGTMREEL